jgi:alpha-glucosidase
MRPGITERTVYLPRGRWFNIWNDHEYNGGKEHMVGCPLDRMPVFIKAGAVIPQWPKQQYVGELDVLETTLHVYFNKEKEVISYLYEDAGDNYGYRMGLYNLHKFYVKGNSKNLILSHILEGAFESNKTFKVVVHGLPFTCTEFVVDGKSHKVTEKNLAVGTVKFKIDRDFKRVILR